MAYSKEVFTLSNKSKQLGKVEVLIADLKIDEIVLRRWKKYLKLPKNPKKKKSLQDFVEYYNSTEGSMIGIYTPETIEN